ncbi:MAG: response regulator transcription factor [Tissierellia bacterium]|nr:response regulator transcription factor [Tissierellia bacterium]
MNLYAQQYKAKEIAEKLCSSINTIKTHTKHIYSKLNINSKGELIL